jgi:hypothetical protein
LPKFKLPIKPGGAAAPPYQKNPMKKITTLILIAAAALLLLTAVNANAQTDTNTPTPPTVNGLISTFGSWIGTYNTNLSFQDIIIWDGPVYENQVNIGNELGASYDVWRQTISTNNTGLASVGNKLGGQMFLGLEARIRQASVAGARVSEAGGLEFGWMKYDFRAGVFADGVYLDHPSVVGVTGHEQAEFGIFAEKMLSPSSALGMFISEQTGQKFPIIGANLNVSFGNGTGFLGLF